jgi:putative hydrolase of the HAD superfamily
MRPKGDCIWVIGDNPVSDIQGGREQINAVTLQKIHSGIVLGVGDTQPDAYFNNYDDLRKLLASINK